MRILLTNDDGINAPGLAVLKHLATCVAGKEGEVWVVAPSHEQSGTAHAISYSRPMEVQFVADKQYSVTGTPADCVIIAVTQLMKNARPDLVLSGVNMGNNCGENVPYSGTVGAAIEASLQGIPAIALSQFLGPKTPELSHPFEAAAAHGAEIILRLLRDGLWQNANYPLFYNVNFPPFAATQVKGTRLVAQGFRPQNTFMAAEQVSPSGKTFLWAMSQSQHVTTAAESDVSVNLDGYISVTPLCADMTAYNALSTLKDTLTFDELGGFSPPHLKVTGNGIL